MNIVGICIIAVVGAILAITLKQTTPQLSLALALITGVVILIAICSFLPAVTEKLTSLCL